MEICLHIGAHRTGTTALQQVLKSGSARLHAGGVGYLGPSALRGWGLYDLIQRMTEDRAPGDRVIAAQAALRDMIDRCAPAKRIVVSDENLSGTMVQNHAEAAIYPDAEPRFLALKRLLPAPPDRICVTLRDFVGYWQSAFTHLAALGKAQAFAAERLTASRATSWLPFLKGVRAAFPNAEVRIMRYDAEVVPRLAEQLLEPDLAHRLPFPDAASVSLQRRPAHPDCSFSSAQKKQLSAAYAADWHALHAGVVAGAYLDPVSAAEDPSG